MKDPLQASSLMFKLYKELTSQFNTDPRYSGYENSSNPKKSDYAGIAGSVYYWFPSHFYKAFDLINKYEEQNKGAITSIKKQADITVIDIGAGTGTFTLALCDFLYQTKQKNTDLPSYNIKAVLVEPNEICNEISKGLITSFAEKAGIKVDIIFVEDKFPQKSCLQKTIKHLFTNTGFLVIGMCNILYWIGSNFIINLTTIKRALGLNDLKEYQFIEKICNHVQPLHGVLFSAETKSMRYPELFSKLWGLYKGLEKEAEDIYDIHRPIKHIYSYINFPASYYGIKNPGRNDGTYYGASIVFNTSISKMSQLETLKLAFFRARMEMRREFPCDEVSIKLMEKSLENNLLYISEHIAAGYSFNPYMMGYEQPKDQKESRPKVFLELADSIAECSFLDIVGRQIDSTFSPRALGNRLNNNNKSEFIYIYFLYAWLRKFMRSSLEKAKTNGFQNYANLDVKSYYTNINQETLLDKLFSHLPQKDERFSAFASSLIDRDIPIIGHSKVGIPQGPIASGFLANVYLDDFDKYLADELNSNRSFLYSRYVDDILLFGKGEKDLLELEKNIAGYLKKELSLELNEEEGKRLFGNIKDLEKELVEDRTLNDFDNRFKKVIRSLYLLDKKHYNQFIHNQKAFIILYRECLKELNINMSERWLQRKLHHEQNIFRNLYQKFISRKYFTVKYPEPFRKKEDVSKWIKEFRRKNPKLVGEIEQLRKILKNELIGIYKKYGRLEKIDEPSLKKQVRRKVRFYTFRAGLLYAPEITMVLKETLQDPWYYNYYVLSNYPELGQDLINVLKYGNSRYIKNVAIWALSEMEIKEAAWALQEILFDARSFLMDKIMCAQALLKMKAIVDVDNIEKEIHKQAVEEGQADPKLLRNLLLLAPPHILNETLMKKIDEAVRTFTPLDKSLTLTAAELVKQNNIDILDEPDILPDFIDTSDYPDIEPYPFIMSS